MWDGAILLLLLVPSLLISNPNLHLCICIHRLLKATLFATKWDCVHSGQSAKRLGELSVSFPQLRGLTSRPGDRLAPLRRIYLLRTREVRWGEVRSRAGLVSDHMRMPPPLWDVRRLRIVCENDQLAQNKSVFIPNQIQTFSRARPQYITPFAARVVNPQQPKEFGVKFSLREIRRTLPIKLRNFNIWKMPKVLNFRFPEGWYFLNGDNTQLKRSSKTIFSVSERYLWAVVGYVGHRLPRVEVSMQYPCQNHPFIENIQVDIHPRVYMKRGFLFEYF